MYLVPEDISLSNESKLPANVTLKFATQTSQDHARSAPYYIDFKLRIPKCKKCPQIAVEKGPNHNSESREL